MVDTVQDFSYTNTSFQRPSIYGLRELFPYELSAIDILRRYGSHYIPGLLRVKTIDVMIITELYLILGTYQVVFERLHQEHAPNLLCLHNCGANSSLSMTYCPALILFIMSSLLP
jgi:hypothetical protein